MGFGIDIESNIKEYAERYYLEHGMSPTVREIASGLYIGKSTVQRHLKSMSDSGQIEYDGRRGIKTEITEKYSAESITVGKVGRISCGPMTFAEQNITDYFQFPASLFGNGEFYILEASGNSMIDAGIDDGDLVVIKKQSTARDGDIVVALYDDNTTLKRFYKDYDSQGYILHPENKELDDIYVKGDLIIQGVAIKVIKDLM